MSDYLTANRKKIKAIIGLGDLVTGSIKRVFDQVGVKPGEIPVVGWGNSRDTTQEVIDGYVNAGEWQDPQATSYLALSYANLAATASRRASTSTSARSTSKDTAPVYDKVLSRQVGRLGPAAFAATAARPPPFVSPRRAAGAAVTRIAWLTPRRPRTNSTSRTSRDRRSCARDLGARVRPVRAARARTCGLLCDQPRFPVRPQHLATR